MCRSHSCVAAMNLMSCRAHTHTHTHTRTHARTHVRTHTRTHAGICSGLEWQWMHWVEVLLFNLFHANLLSELCSTPNCPRSRTGGSQEVAEKGSIPTATLSPPEKWFCVQIGNNVSRFNILLIMRARSREIVHEPERLKREAHRDGIDPPCAISWSWPLPIYVSGWTEARLQEVFEPRNTIYSLSIICPTDHPKKNQKNSKNIQSKGHPRARTLVEFK